jgi:type IV pilus assembly protein PilW
MRRITTHPFEQDQGLTLVELLVALAMAAILSVALVASFSSYSRTQTAQENVISMQQNLRAALYLMSRDLRMAGYNGPNPAGAPSPAGFTTASADTLSFTALNDATNTLTTITYEFFDSNSDGTKDAIRRSDGTMTDELVAEGIDGVEFFYTMIGGGQSTSPGTLANIRSVQITILACTNRNDTNFSNTTTYTTPSGATWTPNDGRRRRMGESVILLRNM